MKAGTRLRFRKVATYGSWRWFNNYILKNPQYLKWSRDEEPVMVIESGQVKLNKRGRPTRSKKNWYTSRRWAKVLLPDGSIEHFHNSYVVFTARGVKKDTPFNITVPAIIKDGKVRVVLPDGLEV